MILVQEFLSVMGKENYINNLPNKRILRVAKSNDYLEEICVIVISRNSSYSFLKPASGLESRNAIKIQK